MPTAVNVTIEGDAATIDKLNGVLDSLKDFSEPLKEIGVELGAYYSGEAFASMGGNFGTPWKALAPSTVAYKTKHYRTYAAFPLMATGRMRESFVSTPSTNSLIIANTASYFVYHQSLAPRHKIPWRPMMWLDAYSVDLIKEIITADVKEKVEAA